MNPQRFGWACRSQQLPNDDALHEECRAEFSTRMWVGIYGPYSDSQISLVARSIISNEVNPLDKCSIKMEREKMTIERQSGRHPIFGYRQQVLALEFRATEAI